MEPENSPAAGAEMLPAETGGQDGSPETAWAFVRQHLANIPKEKNCQAIVSIAERLPESTIQEDASLLMYYDISLGRV